RGGRQHRPGPPGRGGRAAGRLAARADRARGALAPVGGAVPAPGAAGDLRGVPGARLPGAGPPLPGPAAARRRPRRRRGPRPGRRARGGGRVRILIWHVHGAWTTSFVHGPHEYLVPVLPDRGPDGRGRARTYAWPESAREVTP